MTQEYPVFDRLIPLLPGEAKLVSYPQPKPRESLREYAGRIAEQLPKHCLVAGVSFGGMLAQEVAQLVHARACFVIGSIRSPQQLPPLMRMGRLLGSANVDRLLQAVGGLAAMLPHRLQTSSTLRVSKWAGASGAWHRWASSAVLGWSPEANKTFPILQIHGDEDKTFPIRYLNPDVVVPGGKHALTISHPAEVAAAITKYLPKVAWKA